MFPASQRVNVSVSNRWSENTRLQTLRCSEKKNQLQLFLESDAQRKRDKGSRRFMHHKPQEPVQSRPISLFETESEFFYCTEDVLRLGGQYDSEKYSRAATVRKHTLLNFS